MAYYNGIINVIRSDCNKGNTKKCQKWTNFRVVAVDLYIDPV